MTTPGRGGRARRRGVVAALTLALSMSTGLTWGFWSAGSSVGGAGRAAAASLQPGPTPSLQLVGTTATLSWSPTTLSTGAAVGGYLVRRYADGSSTPITPAGGCASTVTSTGCTETGVPDGLWRWTVTPVIGQNWRGAPSAPSAATRVDTTAPTNSVAASLTPGPAVRSGSTLFYRGVDAESTRLTSSVVDAGSGPASATTSALTGPSAGFTHQPSTVSDPAGGPYVSAPISWSAGTTSSPTITVTAADQTGNTSATALTLTDDSTPPTAGSVNYLDGYATGTAVPVAFTVGTDTGSGIESWQVQRSAATLTNGTCGAFGAYTDWGPANPVSPLTDTVGARACYRYLLTATDRVGNARTTTGAGVVKVDYALGLAGESGTLGQWRLGDPVSTTGSWDSFSTGASGTAISARTGETAAGWSKVSGSNLVVTAGGRVRRSAGAATLYQTSYVPASADYSVSADIVHLSTVTNDDMSVAGRIVGGNYYRAAYQAGNWILLRYNSAVATPLATVAGPAIAVGGTRRVTLDMRGSQIRVLVDGSVVIDHTDVAPLTPTGRGGLTSGALGTTSTTTDATGLQLDNVIVETGPSATALDSRGTNPGTYLGGVVRGVAGALPASTDTAATFDGADDQVRVTRQLGDDFSIELWFKSTQGIGTGTQWTQGAGLVDADATGITNDFGISLRSDGRVLAGVGNPDTTVVSSASGLNNNAWHQVVMTRTRASGLVTLYADGLPVGSVTGSTAALTASPLLTLGRITTGGATAFAGSLDEVTTATTAWSAATVADHYALGRATVADLTGPTGGSVDATGLTGTGSRYATSTAITLALVKGSDPSGLAASGHRLQRASATLTNGSCGTYGAYGDIATDPAAAYNTTVTAAACHRFRYIVLDSAGNSTTTTSPDIKVDVTPATVPTLSFSALTNAAVNGTTLYYRPDLTGGFTVTASSSDAESGFLSAAFPSLGSGWSDGTTTATTRAYSWTASPGTPATAGVTARNNAFLDSAGTSITLAPDSTGPQGAAISYPDRFQRTTSIDVALTPGTDAGSGVASHVLERSQAPYTSLGCGAYGAWSSLATNPGPSVSDAGLALSTCYRYRYVATDLLGNQSLATSSAVVTVLPDYATLVASTTGLIGRWRLDDQPSLRDTFTDTAGTDLVAHTGEAGSTWTRHPVSDATAVITPSGRVRKAGASTRAALYYAAPAAAGSDYRVSADLAASSLVAGDTAGVAGRVSTGATTYYGARYVVDAQQWSLVKVVAGATTSLGTAAEALPAGATRRVGLDLSGSRIRVLVDGVVRIDVTDTAITGGGRGGVLLGAPGGTTTSITDATGLQLDNLDLTPVDPTVRDDVGANTGSYAGAVSTTQAGAIAGNAAMTFGGVSASASVARPVQDDFTLEFWFASTQGLGSGSSWESGAPLVDADKAGPQRDFGTSLRADGRVMAGVGDGTSSSTLVSASGGFADGQWHHVAFTRVRSSGELRLYVDGALVDSGGGATVALVDSPVLYFARSEDGRFLQGSLDEVAVYDRALAPTRVAAHYAAR